ncbi:MAG: hypothetical protein C4589_11170 [Peptococcaceae bacterium]|nr:MAG: hypothetical protein C4589_11170 [Peptococcaceae bacterium]
MKLNAAAIRHSLAEREAEEKFLEKLFQEQQKQLRQKKHISRSWVDLLMMAECAMLVLLIGIAWLIMWLWRG